MPGDPQLSKPDQAVFEALHQFADAVRAKAKALASGAPEDQLRAPIENFFAQVGAAVNRQIVTKGETQLADRLGRPDYAVLVDKLLSGYIELKEPGKGANPDKYKAHDAQQWSRFQFLPNIIYTDGNEWALYRLGKRVGPLVRVHGDVTRSGRAAVKPEDAPALRLILTDFLWWEPIVPASTKALAELLAPLCRMLREEVRDALRSADSPLRKLAKEWRSLLFPDADDDRFADAYAQTVTFALLLARSEGARTIDEDLHEPIHKLSADHALMSRALQVLTDKAAREEIAPPLRLLQRVIDCVTGSSLSRDAKRDPWLYFYEDFLAAYDPKLRKDAGAYYTPPEVVHAQVRLIDRLLVEKLGKTMGFADPTVTTLDPAIGTGTYLLGVIDHAMGRVESQMGRGAVAGQATRLAHNIYGFEIMVGPYSVAQLRLSRSLADRGATLPEHGPLVYLTDTLESPHVEPPRAPLFYEALAEQHEKALRVKEQQRVIVCLGNPPYDRHEAAKATSAASRARTGSWVRWGDSRDGSDAIFIDFLQPALDAGHGGDVKNLYNLYVYFWRWALWKVFEHSTSNGPGVVSYISAASYLDGDAFSGMREHMRRLCDEVWIIDLGGEGRGARKSQNVFAIQTPVAIAVAACYGNPQSDKPAEIHYTRLEGTKDQKLARLDKIVSFDDLKWESCPDGWQLPFRPVGKGLYFNWPLLTDLMPWQHSGVQFKRTWPIAPDEQTLAQRWQALLSADDRAKAFKETRDRKVTRSYPPLLAENDREDPIAQLDKQSQPPPCVHYAFRSFDKQRILMDARLGDFMRPTLWAIRSQKQVYLTSSFTEPLGVGPALTACAEVPDLHHFSGRGAKDVVPLYRDSDAQHPNIAPDLLSLLNATYQHSVTPEDFLAYVYAVSAHPAFSRRFGKELETLQIRVPFTKDSQRFAKAVRIGRRLLWLHTYGQRCTDPNQPKGELPRGQARCTQAVPHDPDNYPDRFQYSPPKKRLLVGKGVFEPVHPRVFDFEVSGLKVL